MKILALEKDVSAARPTHADLHAEAVRVWELYCLGIVREIYFRADVHQAVLFLECPDRESAIEIVDSLPLVQKRLVSFDLIPLLPYSGWERLFSLGGGE